MKIDAGTYPIIIERGALSQLGSHAKNAMKPCRAVLVSDDNVYPLYGATVENSLREAGFELAAPFVFPHGEQQKNLTTLGSLLNHLAEEQLTRSDVVFALGGGVVGDTAGFASAIYLRGIRCVQIPTSLLASVDSSVGGKTAVDLPAGKNLAGAFHEPALVLCDPNVFATLTPEFFSDGMAEVIKTAILGNAALFEILEGDISDRMDEVVAMCVTVKRDIVSRDLYDHGERQLLNLGHTVGHAAELLSAYSVSHGHAVAGGMHVIANLSRSLGLCDAALPEQMDRLIEKYRLDPRLCHRYSPENLAEAALHDKKMRRHTITLILPRAIGQCELREFSADDLPDLIRRGMAD